MFYRCRYYSSSVLRAYLYALYYSKRYEELFQVRFFHHFFSTLAFHLFICIFLFVISIYALNFFQIANLYIFTLIFISFNRSSLAFDVLSMTLSCRSIFELLMYLSKKVFRELFNNNCIIRQYLNLNFRR